MTKEQLQALANSITSCASAISGLAAVVQSFANDTAPTPPGERPKPIDPVIQSTLAIRRDAAERKKLLEKEKAADQARSG